MTDSYQGYQCYPHGGGLRKATELKLRNVVTHLEMTGSTQEDLQKKNMEKLREGFRLCPMESQQKGAEKHAAISPLGGEPAVGVMDDTVISNTHYPRFSQIL
ncbi:unnamed protein product [Rangifer tarandus platyrhynchus]|uniref:Uncharacterized protein n=2 Tax=Rangifer tarandus platyrhynchus TaxID=3082113 RepID=A0AC59Y8T0_RANTA|nr:unnamed protein product [Rangifer tarandus platyrhynchus]